MITTRTEAGALPLIGAGKALSAVGNVLLIAYTASEIAEWQDEEEADGKDADFCAQPLIASARTYWAAQIGNYAAAADQRITDPILLATAKGRIAELQEQIASNPEWSLCHVSAAAKATFDLIEQLESQQAPAGEGQGANDGGIDPPGPESSPQLQTPYGASGWGIVAGLGALGALIIWSQNE